MILSVLFFFVFANSYLQMKGNFNQNQTVHSLSEIFEVHMTLY